MIEKQRNNMITGTKLDIIEELNKKMPLLNERSPLPKLGDRYMIEPDLTWEKQVNQLQTRAGLVFYMECTAVDPNDPTLTGITISLLSQGVLILE